MHEHLSLSEFIRQIIGAELSETQKRILDYLQSNERAESVRALFGQLKLREADELNTWVRDYEAYVIRHQGEWTDSYRQMRDSLAEYSQERIQEALNKKVGLQNFNRSFGKLGSMRSILMGGRAMTPEQLVKEYGPNYHPDMSPAEVEKLKEQFKDSPPVMTEEKVLELVAGFKKGFEDSERPLMVIDSLNLERPEQKEFWKMHLTKHPLSLDLPKTDFITHMLTRMPEEDRHRLLRRSAEREEYWIDLEREIPNEDWVRHLPQGVTLTGEAAAKLLRSKMERTPKITQSTLFGSFGTPKGKLAIPQCYLEKGRSVIADPGRHWAGKDIQPDTSIYRALVAQEQLVQHMAEMADLVGTPRMRRSLRSEIREHFGLVNYRFDRSTYRQTGKTATRQLLLDYNIGMLVKDQRVAVTPDSAVGSLDFFREFWTPRGTSYVLQTKHTAPARKPKKGYKK